MAELPSVEQLHTTVASLLDVRTLHTYSRALCAIEEIVELATSPAHCESPEIVPLLYYCHVYEMLCQAFVRELTAQASAREHLIYDRTASANRALGKSKGKRQGVVFDVDKGEHIVAALESLRLEEFLNEQAGDKGDHHIVAAFEALGLNEFRGEKEGECSKHVRFID
ncbi:hypothetical protein F5Y03DRAFT_189163 [Xylaria venustula]|nr:hypothetical protein F5Y03DRAFT_189163 [Xylaria venustula]